MKIAKLVAKNVSPLHTHDCEECKFLGTAAFPERVVDLYVCTDKTLIYRYGVNGEYGSVPGDMWNIVKEGSPYALARELVKRNKIPCSYRVVEVD